MKKDLDYIAGLEKAIREKYGENAIKNPLSEWNEEKEKKFVEDSKERAKILRNRREKELTVEKDGFLIKKKLFNKTSDRNCPICDKYSFESRDDVYITKWGACYMCYINHIEGREEKWEERRSEILNAKREVGTDD